MASVRETQMEWMSPSSADNSVQQRPHKRVAAACDYCRKKRLKCTDGPRPCLNCQLYSARCTDTTTHRKRGPAPSQSKGRNIISAMQSNPATSSCTPLPGRCSNSRTTQPTTRLSNDAILLTDGTNSVSDTVMNVLGRADGLQREDQSNFIEEVRGEGSTLMEWCDQLLDHPAFAEVGQEGLSNQQAILFNELLSESGLQDSASDIYLADLHSPQHYDGANPIYLQRSLSDPAQSSPRSLQAGGSALKVFGSDNLKIFIDSNTSAKAIVPGLFIQTGPSDSGYIGFISTGATLSECLKEPSDGHTVDFGPRHFDWLSNAVPYVHGSGPSSLNENTHELPPQSLAQAGIEAYFKNVHILQPILDQQTFREYWDQLYTQLISSPKSLDVVILHLVVAIGLLFSVRADSASSPNIPMSKQLYQKAWASLHETLLSTGLQSTQALILHVIYQMFVGRNSRAWSICGMALRNAQCLGLHRNFPADSGYLQKQIRLRSQIWWVLFGLDATLSLAEGRPPGVAVDTCDIQLVTINMQSDGSYASNMFYWKVGLAQIQNQLCLVLSRCDTPHDRRSALGEIERSLTKWREDMPVDCRPGQDIIPGSTSYLLITSLHLEYFSLARALYWSYMTCVSAKNDEICTHQTNDDSREYILCLGSARAFVRTLNSAIENEKKNGDFPVCIPADQYAAALAILYRNICRNPEHVATRVDLEYFRACKIHLERNAYPDYVLLAFGNLLNDMMCSVEKLLARTR